MRPSLLTLLVALLIALILAAGSAATGWYAGQGLVKSRLGDRFVSVKGLSERNVKSDLALWPIRIVAAGNDLASVQTKLKADRAAIESFLTARGFSADEFQVQSFEVNDLYANVYRSGPVENRFIVAQLFMVRSADVDRVAEAARNAGELVDQGVVISNEMGPSRPSYLFTRLNDIKPQMIDEATVEAQRAAEQFANNSNSQLGGIRRANQGLFQILPRDQAPGISETDQIEKTVRIVTSIDYFLKD